MQQFQITGGRPLSGTVRASGSKNAALPMMAASILASGPVRLENVPRLADVEILSRLLKELGLDVMRDENGTVRIETVDASSVRAGYELVRQMRASFCVLGPLLARRGRALVSLPGGCQIGDRPVDLHLRALEALGAQLRIEHGYVVARAPRLRGATVSLSGPRGPSVTGTANVLCAATLAEGLTTITGAAQEPEIVDLGGFLTSMGARITGLGGSTIQVVGVEQLGGATYRIIPDRIETATLLLAAAIAQGEITVAGARPEHLENPIKTLRQAGFRCTADGDCITIAARHRPKPIDISAEPYPGIPTDIQAQWMALLARGAGRSVIHDRVFPGRFMHVAELMRLGARIEAQDHGVAVTGVDRLTGAAVTASDLRASAALVLAGLAADGETTVRAIHHLDRGYESLDEKLNQLGARVERLPDEPWPSKEEEP